MSVSEEKLTSCLDIKFQVEIQNVVYAYQFGIVSYSTAMQLKKKVCGKYGKRYIATDSLHATEVKGAGKAG